MGVHFRERPALQRRTVAFSDQKAMPKLPKKRLEFDALNRGYLAPRDRPKTPSQEEFDG